MDIFHNSSKMIPKKADDQTVRVDLDQLDIGGRRSHLPSAGGDPKMAISHVPNAGSTMGGTS